MYLKKKYYINHFISRWLKRKLQYRKQEYSSGISNLNMYKIVTNSCCSRPDNNSWSHFKNIFDVCYRDHLERNDANVLDWKIKQKSKILVSTSNHMQTVYVYFRGSFLSRVWRMWQSVERGSTARICCCCLKHEKNERSRTTEGNTRNMSDTKSYVLWVKAYSQCF